MMTLSEANALPILVEYKDRPNLYRLARIIASSKHSDKIMAVLPLVLSATPHNPVTKEGGTDA